MRKVLYQIMLPKTLKEAIQKEADSLGVTLSSYIRHILIRRSELETKDIYE